MDPHILELFRAAGIHTDEVRDNFNRVVGLCLTTANGSRYDIVDIPATERVSEPAISISSDTPKSNRVLTDAEILNRFAYHRGTEVTMPRHKAVREKYAEMATFVDTVVPPGRSKDKALEALDVAAMWSNKAIAELAPVVMET